VFRLVYPNCAITTQANSAIVQLGGDRGAFDSPIAVGNRKLSVCAIAEQRFIYQTSAPLDPANGFIVFFKYGAIVFYNIRPEEQVKCLRAAQIDFPNKFDSDLRSECGR
jgi:uncharacterized Rmd1/YagE family protein